jgi:DNA-directed RNA polymerase specialized sigma24 family protein
MKKDWELTQNAFDSLLDWLDADRDGAGIKYEAIRIRLIKIFTCRGCSEAEELADETINRVTSRVVAVAADYQGDPAHYFYAVSHKVHQEYLRKLPAQQIDPETDVALSSSIAPPMSLTDDIERVYECLERCLDQVPTENRDLVVQYYQLEKQAKIEHRKLLATEFGIAVNALRIRAHRIRVILQRCVQDCLQQQLAH